MDCVYVVHLKRADGTESLYAYADRETAESDARKIAESSADGSWSGDELFLGGVTVSVHRCPVAPGRSGTGTQPGDGGR